MFRKFFFLPDAADEALDAIARFQSRLAAARDQEPTTHPLLEAQLRALDEEDAMLDDENFDLLEES
jgi:hypothetical protein